MKEYHINVFYSDDDQCFIADIPDLKYCSAHGATAAEAVKQLETAKAAWIESAKKKGKPIPRPRYRPAIYHVAR